MIKKSYNCWWGIEKPEQILCNDYPNKKDVLNDISKMLSLEDGKLSNLVFKIEVKNK